MALLRYLKPRDGLPDPRGALSLSMPSQAIAEANREVQEATNKVKWGPYKRYSTSVRAEIGKYASQHGVAATARVFSKRLDSPVSETTVRSIRSAYIQGVHQKQRAEDDGEIVALPLKKQGRPLLLGH